MRHKRKRFFHDSVHIDIRQLRGAGPRKIQQVIHDFRRPERLLGDLLEQLVPGIFRRDFLTQHLRITRDDGERRIDFVCNAGGEQTGAHRTDNPDAPQPAVHRLRRTLLPQVPD